MKKKYQIHIEPEGRLIEAWTGETLKDVLNRHGYYFPQTCDGKGKCGECRVQFRSPAPRIQPREIELLDRDTDFRLACLHKMESDCAIYIPPIQEWLGDKNIRGFKVSPGIKGFGLAGDLGTTTIALYLLNLENGEIVSQYCFLNPQSLYGADVMTRLEKAKEDYWRKKLHEVVNQSIAQGIIELSKQSVIDKREISRVILAGNTVMTHLFLGWGGEGLERAPFQSPFQHRGWLPFNPGILGLNDHCTCELVPILSGFIGGDTTAAIIAADLDNKKSQRLLIDVGTNGEIVLSQNGTLYAVSTAAGPAFEGVGMHSGMPALKGAIEGISPNGEPLVIGGGSALGFCGSGYISCIDFLRKKGILSPAGLLRENEDKKRSWSPYKNNEPMITQDDIRKFQLAKSALAAGSEILFRETGISAEELAEITITGAFGNRIDPKSAVKIGLLPYIPQERITFIDNAAGRGAALCLGKSYFKERALTLQQTVKVLNLGEHPAFQEVFIKNMSFPLIE